MLTLFAKKEVSEMSLNLFYTGMLCNNLEFQGGRFVKVALYVPLETSLWIIPPLDFHVDNQEMIHPAHLIHQDQKVAHFEFYEYGDQFIFIRQIKPFKCGDRLFCYYASRMKFDGEEYIKLPPTVPVPLSAGAGNKGDGVDSVGGGGNVGDGVGGVGGSGNVGDDVGGGDDLPPIPEEPVFNSVVFQFNEDAEDDGTQHIPTTFDIVPIKTSIWCQFLQVYKDDAVLKTSTSVKASLKNKLKGYRDNLVKNSYLDISIDGLDDEFKSMVYDEIYHK
jgi:hypothetical protein